MDSNIFLVVSLRLLMMLSSKEDSRSGNKKNGCRKGKNGRNGCRKNKNYEPDDYETDNDDDTTTSHLAVSTSYGDEEEEDLIDCRTANRDALKSQVQNNYIPRCTHDGRYEQIQCYKVSYYYIHLLLSTGIHM